jgi:hypothetical protein
MLLPSSGWPNLVHLDVEVIWDRECVGYVGMLQALWPGRDVLVLLLPCRSHYDKSAGFHFYASGRYIPERTKNIWRHTLPFVALKQFRRALHKVCVRYSLLCSSEDEGSTTVRSVSWLPLDKTETSRKTWICIAAAVRFLNVTQNSGVEFGTIQLTRFHILYILPDDGSTTTFRNVFNKTEKMECVKYISSHLFWCYLSSPLYSRQLVFPNVKMMSLWDMMSWGLVRVYRRFGRTCCFQFHQFLFHVSTLNMGEAGLQRNVEPIVPNYAVSYLRIPQSL